MDSENNTTHQGDADRPQEQPERPQQDHVPPPVALHASDATKVDGEGMKTAWQERFRALEERFAKELAQKEEGWRKKESQMKAEIQDKDDIISNLHQGMDHLRESLKQKTRQLNTERAELHQSVKDLDESWKKKESLMKIDIQDKDNIIYALKQSNEHLSESLNKKMMQLQTERDELYQSVRDCQDRVKAVDERLAQREESCKKMESQMKTEIQDKDNIISALHQSKEEQAQHMQKEIRLLEDICLYQKSRRGCFLFRREILDREAALERMKNKLHEREMKKREKEEKRR